jgi:hypothetical protein
VGISIDFLFDLFFQPPRRKESQAQNCTKMPALNLEEDNNTTTRLLTLLNVSALQSSKRKRTEPIEPTPRVKLNKRRSVQIDATESTPAASKEDEGKHGAHPADATGVEDTTAVLEDVENDQGACGSLHRDLGVNSQNARGETRPIRGPFRRTKFPPIFHVPERSGTQLLEIHPIELEGTRIRDRIRPRGFQPPRFAHEREPRVSAYASRLIFSATLANNCPGPAET